MKDLEHLPGVLLLLIFSLTIVAAQDKPATKQAETLDAIPFDQVVMITLLALESNWKVKTDLLPNVHIDDYYIFVLRTAKRLALQDARKDASKIQAHAKKDVKKPEEK